MFHAYCKNSIDHAKLADKVSKSMAKTLKPSLKSRCKFDGYKGSGHYYYFINPIRVISFVELDNGSITPRYSGELRRDYLYNDEEYNKDIFIDTPHNILSYYTGFETTAVEYKKSYFNHTDANRYKLDGIYVNCTQDVVVDGKSTPAVMLEAGLKTGDIARVDNRDCFLIKYVIYERCYCIAIAID